MILKNPGTYASIPNYPVGIDPAHPLSVRTIYAIEPGNTSLRHPRYLPHNIKGQTKLVGYYNSTEYATLYDMKRLRGTPFTIRMRVYPILLTPAYSPLFSYVRADAGNYAQLFIKSNGKLAVYYRSGNNGSSGSYDGTGSATLALKTWYDICLILNSDGSQIRCYVDNVLDGSFSFPAGSGLAAGTDPMYLGFDSLTAGRIYIGLMSDVVFFNKEFTTLERTSFFKDPGQLFTPQPHTLYVAGATSSNVSVSLSGLNLSFLQGTAKSAIVYTPSGQQVTTSSGTIKAALAQALSGQALTLSAGTVKSAVSYTLTGQSTTVSQGTIVASTGGSAVSVNLSGTALTISQGTVKAAIAQTLSGQGVTASRGTLVPGVSTTLSGTTLTASVGTLTSAISRALSGSALTMSTGTLSSLSGTIITIKAGSWIRYRTI